MSSASKLRAAIVKKRAAMSVLHPNTKRHKPEGRGPSRSAAETAMRQELEEIEARGACSQKCGRTWTKHLFERAHKAGSERRNCTE